MSETFCSKCGHKVGIDVTGKREICACPKPTPPKSKTNIKKHLEILKAILRDAEFNPKQMIYSEEKEAISFAVKVLERLEGELIKDAIMGFPINITTSEGKSFGITLGDRFQPEVILLLTAQIIKELTNEQ